MTAIAAFAVEGCPVLFGDLLLSFQGGDERDVRLPASGDVSKIVTSGGLRVCGTGQKVVIVSRDCAIAWSGDEEIAGLVIHEVRTMAGAAPLTAASIQTYLESHERVRCFDMAFIGFVREGDAIRRFAYRAAEFPSQRAGSVLAAGSGTPVMCEFIHWLDVSEQSREGEPNNVDAAIAAALQLMALLLLRELQTVDTPESLREMFGGGYEVAVFADGEFQKIRDVTMLLWGCTLLESGEVEFMPVLAMKQHYARSSLLLRSAKLSMKDGAVHSGDEQVHIVSPMYAENPPQEDLIQIGLHSPLYCHVFLVNGMGVLTKVTRGPSVTLPDEGDTRMGLYGPFFEGVVKSIHRAKAANVG